MGWNEIAVSARPPRDAVNEMLAGEAVKPAVMAGAVVNAMAELVAEAFRLSPANTAVMLWEPVASVEVVNVAEVPDNATAPLIAVVPS